MNALEKYRIGKGLTYQALADLAGFSSRAVVFEHCRAGKIPGGAALVYHAKLGIPLTDLRPDLFGPGGPDEAA